MSVMLAKGSALCERCMLLSHPYISHSIDPGWLKHGDALRVFVETNDLCSRCDTRGTLVRHARQSDEGHIIRRVEKKSPFLRAQRRAVFFRKLWKTLLDPYCQLFIITLLLGASLFIGALIGFLKLGGLL